MISVRTGRALNRAEKNWFVQQGDFGIQFKTCCDVMLGFAPESSYSEKEARQRLPDFLLIIKEDFQKSTPNFVN